MWNKYSHFQMKWVLIEAFYITDYTDGSVSGLIKFIHKFNQ